jgi:hypothetical protein
MDPSNLTPLRRQIEDEIKEPRESVEIDVWLESPGGDAHVAYKLALMLRAAAAKIRVVVPDYAKSAATLLAVAGDEIYMAPGAELGPLDGQMPDEGSLAGSISALNIAKAADDVAKDAVDLAIRGGVKLIDVTGLKREKTLEAMLGFASNFSEPLVRQLDPRLIHDAKETLRITKLYAERLLAKTLPPRKAADVARQLVEQYPSHAFVISYDEALDLGLPVRPIGEYDLREPMQALHRAAEDGNALIKLISAKQFTGEEEEEEGDDSELAEERSADSEGNEGGTS